ncbi:MAG: FAD-binding oxidoreductase [Dongiaceae bacterium]
MPRRILVVGGGAVGCSVAWHLAERGLGDVTLIERDRLGSGTTWHSAGNLIWRPGGSHDGMVLYAFDAFDRLKRETEQDTGWLKTGRLFLAHGGAAIDGLETYQRGAVERGIDSRMITGREAASMHPLLNGDAITAAWWNPLAGRVNPADLVAAYAKAARRAGAKIIEQRAVTGLVMRGGRVSGVETSEGPIEADVVVMAAGLWSRDLLLPVDVTLAQWACEHFYVIANTEPRLPRETPSFVSPEDLFYGREEVGGMLVGFFDENARTIAAKDLPEPFAFTLLGEDWDKIAPYFEAAARIFPALETAPIRSFVNGPESFTPDDMPLIGPVPSHEGLYIATAMNSGGVTYSAATGRIIADFVAGDTPSFDAAIFDPMRFGDRADDVDWLQRQISAVVSRGYRETNL